MGGGSNPAGNLPEGGSTKNLVGILDEQLNIDGGRGRRSWSMIALWVWFHPTPPPLPQPENRSFMGQAV